MTQKKNKHRCGQAAEEAERMTHLSLFTGIGGLDLAAIWAGFTTVGQCEFADYPTKVLEKHWPDVERWKDVRDLTRKSNGVPNRVDRTKALGNCVVPQQFYPIFAAISEMEVWR